MKGSVINKKYSIERQKKAERRALNDIQDIWRNVSDEMTKSIDFFSAPMSSMMSLKVAVLNIIISTLAYK